MPQSEFSDYLNLQKEIKRLNEDNLHFSNENKILINRLKNLEARKSPALLETHEDAVSQKRDEETIDKLKQEIFVRKI